jgi:hypothetical protein
MLDMAESTSSCFVDQLCKKKSHRPDLNRRPSAYKADALPLSYCGLTPVERKKIPHILWLRWKEKNSPQKKISPESKKRSNRKISAGKTPPGKISGKKPPRKK